MKLTFDVNSVKDTSIFALVSDCLKDLKILETTTDTPLVISQDGKSKGYYIRCCMLAEHASPLLDMNAKLNPTDAESFRANRELLTEHNTFKRMVADAKTGREFNDIIVEFSKDYAADKPLKIWGGQHRAKAIQQAYAEAKVSRFHGFRIYFNLSKPQRTELALISNTNISVSNDLFDRLQEETVVGIKLREWCYQTGLLKKPEDFPDQGSKAERVTVKLARTFVTNFFHGKQRAEELKGADLDKSVYEPYLCESGVQLDPEYDALVAKKTNLMKEQGKGGPLTYLFFVFAGLFQYKFIEAVIDVDGQQVFKGEIFSMNVGICKFNGGGMMQVPYAVPDDGLFDITSGILREVWDFKSGKLPEQKKIEEFSKDSG